MIVSKLASAIYNDILGGLSGYGATLNMSLEQLEDEVVEERLMILKTYSLKNLIPRKDLFHSINCIKLDCAYLEKCCSNSEHYSDPVAHFEIPQTVNDFGEEAIEYIGSIDKTFKFKVYTDRNFKYHQFKIRGKNRPYIYVDTTPNANNYYDCYVFNAPLLETISIIAIFKDPRQVEQYMKENGCCEMSESENYTWISTEVKKSLINKKLAYYRLYQGQVTPNNQNPK